MDYISVTNWDKHQHYRDRDPVWIKLYHKLLDDLDYQLLSDKDKLIFLEVLMVSARTSNLFPDDPQWLKRTLTVRGKIDFSTLIDKGFLVTTKCKKSASEMLAGNYQVDTHSPLLLIEKYYKEIGIEKEYAHFKKMRREIKKPVNEIAARRLVAKHKHLVEEGHDPAEIVNQSTASCWQGFHPIKDYPYENGKQSGRTPGRTDEKTPAEKQRDAGREFLEGLSGDPGKPVATVD